MVGDDYKQWLKGGCDINRIGNAYITASPIKHNETFPTRLVEDKTVTPKYGDFAPCYIITGSVLTPFLDTIHNSDIALIVDVANSDNSAYIQPYYTENNFTRRYNVTKDTDTPMHLDPEDFRKWQLISCNGSNPAKDLEKDDYLSVKTLQNSYISVFHKEKPLSYIKLAWADGGGQQPENLLDYCAKIHKIAKDSPPLFHCNGGMGRSATFLCAYQMYCFCKKAKEMGMAVTYDMGQQKSLVLEKDGKSLNLACVFRNLAFEGRAAREIFIQATKQWECLDEYGAYLAKNFQSL
ncbi:MAG: hypothetical protein LBI69_04380 [Puniceicoccales bacterium]|nr:hypothetical protein [Puniceicoccales bacterium]